MAGTNGVQVGASMNFSEYAAPQPTGYGLQASALLITGASNGPSAGAEALAAAGMRLLGPVAWHAAAERLAAQAMVDLVLIEASDGDDDSVAPVFSAADRLAAEGVPVIAIIDTSQIDLASAMLVSGRSQLLCAPSVVEQISAIVLTMADAGGHMLNDSARDGETMRLQRLNEEVARIAETLARLTRGDASTTVIRRDGVADRNSSYDAGPVAAPDLSTRSSAGGPVTASDVRQAIRLRRLREQIFAGSLFEDPAWDMLLDLFAAELERAQVSVSSLCIAAAVAPTTALRWIGRMTEAGLFVREADPFDRRRAFMGLSNQAREGMHAYWAAAKRLSAAAA